MPEHTKEPNQTEKLTDAIEDLDETLEKSLKAQGYWPAFFRGAVGAVGAAIGATLILGLIILVLQKLADAPIIGHYILNILNQLQQGK